jgi:hypothetical protein
VSVDNSGLVQFQRQLEALRNEVPDIMEELVVGEGVYAVKQAKLICKNDSPDIVNNGDYRTNFHAGDKALTHSNNKEHDGSKPKMTGKRYRIDVYNNLDYAKPLEYGFRSHFVPGHWDGRTFVYQRNDPEGGMYVGPYKGYVRGHFTLRRAIKRTKDTQDARLNRKINRIIKERLTPGGSG